MRSWEQGTYRLPVVRAPLFQTHTIVALIDQCIEHSRTPLAYHPKVFHSPTQNQFQRPRNHMWVMFITAVPHPQSWVSAVVHFIVFAQKQFKDRLALAHSLRGAFYPDGEAVMAAV